jgi:hypothetical protein
VERDDDVVVAVVELVFLPRLVVAVVVGVAGGYREEGLE